MYLVYENDEYGREVQNILLVREASSKEEAREKAAQALGVPAITQTGWYNARIITQEEIDKIKFRLRSELEFFSERII